MGDLKSCIPSPSNENVFCCSMGSLYLPEAEDQKLKDVKFKSINLLKVSRKDKEALCIYCSDKSPFSGCLARTRVSHRSWPDRVSIRQSPRPQGNLQARIKYKIRGCQYRFWKTFYTISPHRQFSDKVSIIYWLSSTLFQIWEVLAAPSLHDLLLPGDGHRVLPPAGRALGVAHAHVGPRQLLPGHGGGHREDDRTLPDNFPDQRSKQVKKENPLQPLSQGQGPLMTFCKLFQ